MKSMATGSTQSEMLEEILKLRNEKKYVLGCIRWERIERGMRRLAWSAGVTTTAVVFLAFAWRTGPDGLVELVIGSVVAGAAVFGFVRMIRWTVAGFMTK